MKINKWNNKDFAFTIIDDTDRSNVFNIKPVYDYLYKKGIITTKTVWAFESRDDFYGDSLEKEEYKEFIKDIRDKGFEIAFHGAGSGEFTRMEIKNALESVKETVGYYPRIHINHASNSDCIYWGGERFSQPFKLLYNFYKKLKNKPVGSNGSTKTSRNFWGDICKEKITYIRNRVFFGLNTLKYDRYMPYYEKRKEKYSNFWFSSSNGINKDAFVRLLSKRNIDKLISENGCAIVYTHFADGFVDENGILDKGFKDCIDYLSERNGWFAPASEILDYINNNREKPVYINVFQSFLMDFLWSFESFKNAVFKNKKQISIAEEKF